MYIVHRYELFDKNSGILHFLLNNIHAQGLKSDTHNEKPLIFVYSAAIELQKYVVIKRQSILGLQ